MKQKTFTAKDQLVFQIIFLNVQIFIMLVRCLPSLYIIGVSIQKNTKIKLEKDERSFEMQIKNRKKNLDESKKNIHGVVTSLISNAGLSDDLLLE